MAAQLLLAFLIITTVMAQVQFDNSACGSVKGCMLSPPGCDPVNNCTSAFSWRVVGDFLNMELTGVSSGGSTNYIAVGFSSDDAMGNEPVTDCTFGPQGAAPHLSYNFGKSNQRVTDYSALNNDLQLTNSNTNNGRMYCAIQQRIVPSQSNSQVLSLNQSVYILLAVGTASDQALFPHDLDLRDTNFPFVASDAFNLSSLMYNISLSSGGISNVARFRMVKAHGIMMILAWFIFVTTAIMFARYFRGHWPDTKPMGLLLWFHLHRSFNVLAVLLMVAAFILIFVAQGRWTGPTPNGGVSNSQWGSVHSMTGILAFCLAFVQPFGAIFRCAPGKPLRPVFNWLHRFAGIAGWLLAATSITIAAKWFGSDWSNPDAAYGLVIAYLVFLGLIIVLQELLTIYDMIKSRRASHINVLEMQAAGKAPVTLTMPSTIAINTNSKTKLIRLLLMGLFMVIGCGMAIAMVVLIAVK